MLSESRIPSLRVPNPEPQLISPTTVQNHDQRDQIATSTRNTIFQKLFG